jgi:predicted RNase H-like HicB family nuclease
MRRSNGSKKTRHNETQLPVFIQKDEDGFYVVECPLFDGCYTQGRTVDEALRNIREVIELVLEEKSNREILETYHPNELSLHTITLSS